LYSSFSRTRVLYLLPLFPIISDFVPYKFFVFFYHSISGISGILESSNLENWRGLRDDFRTFNWVEIIDDLGLNTGVNNIDHFLQLCPQH